MKMDKITQKKRQPVIHVHIRPTLEKDSGSKHLQNKSLSSDFIPGTKNITLKEKEKIHGQQDLLQPYFSVHPYPTCTFQDSERSRLSISRNKSNNKNRNRVSPSLQPSSLLDGQKNSIARDMASETKQNKKYCGLSLWSCLLLLYLVVALVVIIAAIITGILSANKAETSAASVNSTSACMSTASYTCSNLIVKANWDYNGNDITNNGSLTFASCCAWCMSMTLCVAFTFNPFNVCYIKNSTGTGGVLLANSTAAAARC